MTTDVCLSVDLRDEATAIQLVDDWKASERPWSLFHIVLASALAKARDDGRKHGRRDGLLEAMAAADTAGIVCGEGWQTKRSIVNAIRARLGA